MLILSNHLYSTVFFGSTKALPYEQISTRTANLPNLGDTKAPLCEIT